MSLSFYLISHNQVTTTDVALFLKELMPVNINCSHTSAQIVKGTANVWIDFLGATVIDESDAEELARWAEHLGHSAIAFFELTVGKGAGSMSLAVAIAKTAMTRWEIIVDDLNETIYDRNNIDKLLC